MKRAMSEEAKEARRQQILDCAGELFEHNDFHEVTVSQIAREVGLAKGTVYLYFGSKEELFLHLLISDLQNWFAAIQDNLDQQQNRKLPPEKLADLFASSLNERQDLLRLLAILHTVLEQNIDVDAALRFKRQLAQAMQPVAARLDQHLPGDHPDRTARLLLWLNATVVGLYQMANPAPAVAQAMQEPDLAPFQVDFPTELRAILTAYLRGIAP